MFYYRHSHADRHQPIPVNLNGQPHIKESFSGICAWEASADDDDDGQLAR